MRHHYFKVIKLIHCVWSRIILDNTDKSNITFVSYDIKLYQHQAWEFATSNDMCQCLLTKRRSGKTLNSFIVIVIAVYLIMFREIFNISTRRGKTQHFYDHYAQKYPNKYIEICMICMYKASSGFWKRAILEMDGEKCLRQDSWYFDLWIISFWVINQSSSLQILFQ